MDFCQKDYALLVSWGRKEFGPDISSISFPKRQEKSPDLFHNKPINISKGKSFTENFLFYYEFIFFPLEG